MKSAKRKKRGAPSKLTPEVRALLLEALLAGNFRAVAARCAGISDSTLKGWLRLGKKSHSGEFAKLRADVHKAEADAEAGVVRNLMAQAQTDTKAMAFWLERKHPTRWGKRTDVKLTGNLQHDATPDAMQAITDLFEKLAGDDAGPSGTKPP